MIRKTNRYSKPRKSYEASRMKDENLLVEKYGLKNKKEIWKTIAKVNYFRKRAMALAKAPEEEQEVLFGKLRGLGLKVNTTADVLALTVEDLLNRRLPTILAKKGFASTVKAARQMVVHRRVMINDRFVKVPSYLVFVNEENNIKIKSSSTKPAKKEEAKSEVEAAPAEVKA